MNNKGLRHASIEDILAEVNIEIAMFVCKLRRISDYWLEKHFVSSYDLKKTMAARDTFLKIRWNISFCSEKI